MPQEATNAALDLEGLEVLGVAAFEQVIEVVVESRFEAGSCRSCGGIAAEPRERPETLVRDLPMCGRPVILRWRKRRWRCTYCSKTWTESHPQVPPRTRMTLHSSSISPPEPPPKATSPRSQRANGCPTTRWPAPTRRVPI
ncbi:MAG: hypothetical protein GEU78_20015 [Actinobacteria bacterium]|nr:hypothetical protein [Actinomycetota bacterium]